MTEQEQHISNLSGIPINVTQITIGGFLVNYSTTGSGPAVLLLHGANMGWGQWYEIIPQLAAHYTVYALDFPGAGESSHINSENLDFQKHFIDLATDFIKTLNLSPVHVVGHSVGAWVALNLALDKNIAVRSLTLISPLGFSKYNSLRQAAAGIAPLAKLLSKTVLKPTRKNIHTFLQGPMKQPEKLNPAFVDYYYNSVTKHPSRHPLRFINRLSGPIRVRSQFVMIDKISKITQPTLLIAGAHDPIVRVEDVRKVTKLFKNAKIKIIEDSGHVPFIESSGSCNSLILEFLKHQK